MDDTLRKKIETVLDEHVRPLLTGHGGNIEIVAIEDGKLSVRLLGNCSTCPSNIMTLESVVKAEVLERVPEVSDVALVTGVSDSLIEMAQSIMAGRKKSQ